MPAIEQYRIGIGAADIDADAPHANTDLNSMS